MRNLTSLFNIVFSFMFVPIWVWGIDIRKDTGPVLGLKINFQPSPSGSEFPLIKPLHQPWLSESFNLLFELISNINSSYL